MKKLRRATIIGVALSAVAALFPSAALTYPSVPAVRVLAISYPAHDGLSRRAYLILPAWYGPLNASGDPTRHLTARAWRRRSGEHPSVGRPPGPRRLRRHQPRGPRPEADALLVGRPRRDPRPGTDAADRGARRTVAAHRPPSRLRVRRQHGRTGNPSSPRAVSTTARRRSRVRRTDEHGGAISGVRSPSLRLMDCRGSRVARSAVRLPRILADTRSAARSTGQGRLLSPACRSRSGGAGATGSSATRSTSRACSTVTSNASIQSLPSANSSARGRTRPRWPRTAICPMRCRGSASCRLAQPRRPCRATRMTPWRGS